MDKIQFKVTAAVGSSNKTASSLDLVSDLKLPESVKSQIKNDIGDYLVESIISAAGDSKSPVAGGAWKKALSDSYKKQKVAQGLPGVANMEESGDLLDSLTYKTTDSGIDIGWFGSEAGKADGHNNFSGDSPLPRRQTLPDEGQKFSSEIQKNIEKIISDAVNNNTEFDSQDFEGIDNKAELYNILAEYFPDAVSNYELRLILTRNPELAALLDEMDLIDLL